MLNVCGSRAEVSIKHIYIGEFTCLIYLASTMSATDTRPYPPEDLYEITDTYLSSPPTVCQQTCGCTLREMWGGCTVSKKKKEMPKKF
jgi:hypothetical protein